MTSKSLGYALLLAGAVTICLLLVFNYEVLSEAFGSGPPYYGRTTNMDKWSNPLPMLFVIDSAALILAGYCIFRGKKWLHGSR